MEGYWKKLGGDNDVIELDLSQWMLRVTTDYGFHFVANKKVYSLADYFNQISPNEKVKIDSTVLKETTKFIRAL